MRAACIVAVGILTVPPPGFSQTVAAAPWMTGQRFLDLVAFPPPASKDGIAQHIDREAAHRYVQGVHDATEGKAWCYGAPYKPKPDILEDAAVDGIKQLAPAQLKRNAADLIVEIWRARYPCPGPKERP